MAAPQPRQQKHTVTQSNHLIQAAYELSLNEKRLIMLALTKVNPKKWEQDWEIEIYAAEWAGVFNKELKHSYGEIEQSVNQLTDRKITFRTGPDIKGKKTFESGRWVSWARYVPGEGKVTLEVPKNLRKYLGFTLLGDEGFTTYRLMAAAKLRSSYSIRLYELLMKWKKTGKYLVTVDDLRECLDMGSKYRLFSDFRKWVINPSVKDITKNTEYDAAWDVHKKKGRKITALAFTLKKKKQKEFDFGGLVEEPA